MFTTSSALVYKVGRDRKNLGAPWPTEQQRGRDRQPQAGPADINTLLRPVPCQDRDAGHCQPCPTCRLLNIMRSAWSPKLRFLNPRCVQISSLAIFRFFFFLLFFVVGHFSFLLLPLLLLLRSLAISRVHHFGRDFCT